MEASENCSVKAVVHVRPLIGDERQQGCREWVTVTPGKPQVQIGTHSFTFDHVYGSGGSPSSAMFGECVAPLVDGLFQGYNATVLAYGQTGSGKTYTMGTGFKDGRQTGLIPEVMSALYGKIETLKHQTEFQMHVSFIEIFKEEVRDLLDSVSIGKSEAANGHAFKAPPPPRSPIHIRETSDGVITLSGSTDVPVSTLQEMAACLEQGSLIRATGSTNMNSQSSRSHAIFTITLEQVHKLHSTLHGNNSPQDEDMGEEYFCAKLHLVDLAGSERAKRTGSDGLRLKEGIHINKGLLALGNVISALGDEKKQKEGVHIPYRDSKLTRLLQDSLGGNSKTVMIACISPADINAEESLNTLKYANRARNIQNKPVVNKDLVANEMQKMRQQIKLLQSELCARGGVQSDEVQVLKERITLLETTNKDLYRELHEYRSRYAVLDQRETDAQVPSICSGRSDGLKRVFQNIDSFDGQIRENISSENPGEMEEVAKECEHALRRDTMDKEMIELNRRLKQKESEMKHVDDVGVETVKQHFRKKISELKEEKRTVQKERDQLLAEVESLAANFDAQAHRAQDICAQKLKSLEGQILDLKKQENHVQIVKQKQKSDESAQQRLQAEIQYIKSQKVKLQHKIKQEAEQFRQWKASCEKELQQLKKEGRRNEYERHKLQALNQRQKLVLQRKTAEVTMATKRLKELLEARKPSARDNSGNFNGNGHAPSVQGNEKKIQRWLDHELEVMVKMHEVRCEHEKQTQVAALQEELALLKQVEQFSLSGKNPSKRKKGFSRVSSMSPNARMARIASLENMLNVSSSALVSMDAQLLEAEDRDRALVGRGRWNQLRTMGETKNLLELLFSAAAESRCRLWEKEMEIKDVKEKLSEVMTLLQQSEAQRKELLKEQKMKEQVIAIALSTSSPGNSHSPPKHFEDDLSSSSSPVSLPAPKQLKLTPGIVNGPVRESVAFISPTQKMIPIDQLSAKKVGALGQSGKLWRWKRSHHQWLMQFKWKWAKPWKLSEWIRHNDETIIKLRSPSQARVELIG